ncbi:peptidylprolyl isomerase [Persephonella sp.]|uniref:peptidylprolyl isomerase n=1 Tax=Persephonella sp. TaxID=2060922 RepID=UPI0025CCDA03|nr:peptidylprolyl isomerase [Persephonella sp.]
MRKIIYLLLSLFITAEAFQGFSWNIDPELKKKVVAVVGNKKITEMDVQRYMKVLLPMNYYHRTLTDEKLKEIRKKAIEALINRELLYYEAQKKGIKIPEKQVDDLIDQLAKKYKSKENLEKLLKQTGVTLDQFRLELKKRLAIDKLLSKYVTVNITEKDLKEYYEKNKYKFKEPPALKIRYIYIKVDPSKPKGRQIAKERAEKAYKEIKEGKDFGDVAYRYSDDLSRIKGGELGFVHRGRFDKPVEEVIYKLKKGQVSEIIETELGFHIVKVEDKRPERLVPFEKIKDKLKKELEEKYRKEKFNQLIEDAKKDLKVVVYGSK